MKTQSRFFLALATFIFVFAIASVGSAAKKVVAVMPLENVSGYTEHRIAEIMSEHLTDVLFRSGRVTVVERMQLENALREMGFDMTGAVDPNTAVEIGKMLGAEYSLIGKVTLATAVQNVTWTRFHPPIKGKVAVNIRILDNNTGELKRVVTAEGSKAGSSAEAALHDACKEAAEIFLEEILDRIVGVVIDTDQNTIYIDAGTEQGIRKGEKLEIVKEGAPVMKDGVIIAMKYIALGKAKVVEANADYSICEITDREDGLAIGKGAIVRRMKR